MARASAASGALLLAPELARAADRFAVLAPSELRPGAQRGYVDPATKDLLLAALDAAKAAGAQYADARVARYLNRRLSTRERQITGVSDTESMGIGVRALVNGSWGFSATDVLTAEAAAQAGRQAAAIGRASASARQPALRLAPVDAFGEVTWRSEYEVDPWDVAIEDVVGRLLEVNEIALRQRGVAYASSGVQFVKEEKTLATTDGTIAAQTMIRTNPTLSITAVSADRSDFATRGETLYPQGRGYEYFRDALTDDAVAAWAADAVAQLSAEPVDPGRYDLVLHPTHLWLTIHESIGHPTELDRALGYEANYAGTSFLAPPARVLNQLRYGPEFMNIQGERTSPGGLNTIGWDDEGVPTHEWLMVRDGVFVDYQTTREQVDWIREQTGVTRSHACAHGDSWRTIPFQRMPNTNLMPGAEDLSVDDLIGATDDGIFIEGRSSYSIDQQRYNFQFSGQVAWEIRNGRKTRRLRDVAYQANTLEFWNAMDLIGGRSSYEVHGTFNDGKGQPGQGNAVSHGTPPARFRQVNVLNTGRRS
ncbi:MAG TPA: TldD/PmbA family protein [Longimicrobiales bacterium]